jgi:methylmalonyl-CoA carboxyltransferase small subunit
VKLRITLEGKSYEVEVDILPETAPETDNIEEIALPESVLRPPPRPDTREQDKICRSPIAGVVVSIAAAVHQKLRRNDPVVVIEAMKMQTAIGAPVDGVVREVHVTAGETVKAGQLLCTLS